MWIVLRYLKTTFQEFAMIVTLLYNIYERTDKHIVVFRILQIQATWLFILQSY